MLVPELLILAFAASGLFAALRPKVWCNCFLAEYQRKQVAGNIRIISQLGWVFFAVGLFVLACVVFPAFASVVWTKLDFVLPAVVAVAYVWWGRGLFLHPERFLANATAPFNRIPPLAIKSFGILLLLGSVVFLYLFVTQIRDAMRYY